MLQHGSILLARSQFAPEALGIEEAAGIAIRKSEITTRWPPLLAGKLKMQIQQGRTTDDERRQTADDGRRKTDDGERSVKRQT